MAPGIDLANYRMGNGRHRGELITRVPVSYLRWMVNERHQEAEVAAQELARRGTVFPNVDISGHAIDRASLRCLGVWRARRRDGKEGLHAWMTRAAEAAYQKLEKDAVSVVHDGVRWVFHRGGVWPTVKTVMLPKPKKSAPRRKGERA